jgi:signal transduction histidine kinase
MFDYAADNIDTDNDLVLMGTRDYTGKSIPTSLQLFVLERFLLYAEPINNDPLISKKVKRAEIMIPKLKMSLEMSDKFKDISFISDTGIINSSVFRLDTEGQLYGHYKQINSESLGTRKYLKIYLQSTVEHWFSPYIEDMEELPAKCTVYDEKGDIVAGEKITDLKPFIKSEVNIGYFPDYITELYIHSSAFEDAADKQAAVYMWAGVLVIVLMLATGGLAGRAMGRQIKMNRLKNDFIATVSHELKTPLASMRVLADTLLEGNYRDQQQVTEYLELICKENKRLSGLIDNFLTFSRMERNKQKFDINLTSPASIAQAAVEAVKTKFEKRQCNGQVEINENLPDIMADHDAMVTVLVNLLDNACKYSYDNKQIQLKVFSENNYVCFSVKDNGIGMTRRQIRKIFNRFYQADSTLSRRAEGTGLGLSIVKFIVDAHKGNITVDSKPGEGSTFTVTLPVGN